MMLRQVWFRGLAVWILGIILSTVVLWVMDTILALFGCESCIGPLPSFLIGVTVGAVVTLSTIVWFTPWIFEERNDELA